LRYVFDGMALKQRTSPSKLIRLKLRIELVPKPLWEQNLRSNDGLGKARWDKFRRKLIETDGARCAICGSAEKLHGHEIWAYREKKTVGTAVLLRVEIVCIDCHDIHHWARTTKLFQNGVITGDRYGFLRRHFRKINGCRQQTFDDHFLRSMRIWSKRSAKTWRVNWGDFKLAVAEAKAAREVWTMRNSDYSQDNSFDIGPGHHLPNRCPQCGASGMLKFIETGTEGMTEGQEADHDQGLSGFAFCHACNSDVFWQV
jgi:hypothetical protein